MCIEAKKLGVKKIILPKDNAKEAGVVKGINIIPADNLKEVIDYLNKEIEKKAFQLAQDTINEIKTEKEIVLRRKEQSFDDLIKEMAEALLKENKKYVGKEITEEAIERIKTKEEGGLKNEKKKTTRKTRKTV